MERNRVEINRRLVISIKKLARKDRTEMMMMMMISKKILMINTEVFLKGEMFLRRRVVGRGDGG